VAEVGAENVVNASIGQVFDDDETFWVLPTPLKILRSLDSASLCRYAPLAGTADLSTHVLNQVPVPAGHHAHVIATPGGAGALHLVLYNYTNMGDAIVAGLPGWPPYFTIATEAGRRLVTHPFFTATGGFHVDAFLGEMQKALEGQGRAVGIINSPAHNPSGYSLTHAEWQGVSAGIRTLAVGGAPIVVLIDAAYLEFAADPDDARQFLQHFADMPPNVLITVAWSGSKAYTLYGMRLGAAMAISHSPGPVQEFADLAKFSARGTWSNAPRPGMSLLSRLVADPALNAQVDAERADLRATLAKRARLLTQSADLDLLPFSSGFFMVMRHSNPQEAAQLLTEKNVFVVPTSGGVRIALSSVPSHKLERLAKALYSVQTGS
jgi:aromatic-amino-acid transaminase